MPCSEGLSRTTCTTRAPPISDRETRSRRPASHDCRCRANSPSQRGDWPEGSGGRPATGLSSPLSPPTRDRRHSAGRKGDATSPSPDAGRRRRYGPAPWPGRPRSAGTRRFRTPAQPSPAPPAMNSRVASAGLVAPHCRGCPATAMEHLRAADPFERALRIQPAGSRPDGLHVATGGHPCSQRCTRGESISVPAVREFNGPRRESFSVPHTMEIFHAHKPLRRATVDLGCSFGTQKTSSAPVGLRATIRALHISGQFSGGASSRRHGVRTVRTLVYCPKGDMTWHLAP